MNMIKRNKTRNLKFTAGVNPYVAGSVIAECGRTKIYVTAVIEESVPPFLNESNQGWVTAEYSMLPASTHSRATRERGKPKGRTMEIQRLIGRSLRSIVDLKKLGKRSILIDCDVLVADGGTRTLSVSAGFIVLKMAIDKLLSSKKISSSPLRESLAATSVGINEKGDVLADLDYTEDSSCSTDMNIVMTESGKLVEIQGTAEKHPFSKKQLDAMLDCASMAMKDIFSEQKKVLSQWKS
ncbi:MAG: ribonuclease PH [Halobacteriovoraceae bacterium]|nr:ribonuclease PH [Halobacteriovoraceae bacterium]